MMSQINSLQKVINNINKAKDKQVVYNLDVKVS